MGIGFDRLKSALMLTLALEYPRPDIPCILDTDSSDVALGGVLRWARETHRLLLQGPQWGSEKLLPDRKGTTGRRYGPSTLPSLCPGSRGHSADRPPQPQVA